MQVNLNSIFDIEQAGAKEEKQSDRYLQDNYLPSKMVECINHVWSNVVEDILYHCGGCGKSNNIHQYCDVCGYDAAVPHFGNHTCVFCNEKRLKDCDAWVAYSDIRSKLSNGEVIPDDLKVCADYVQRFENNRAEYAKLIAQQKKDKANNALLKHIQDTNQNPNTATITRITTEEIPFKEFIKRFD